MDEYRELIAETESAITSIETVRNAGIEPGAEYPVHMLRSLISALDSVLFEWKKTEQDLDEIRGISASLESNPGYALRLIDDVLDSGERSRSQNREKAVERSYYAAMLERIRGHIGNDSAEELHRIADSAPAELLAEHDAELTRRIIDLLHTLPETPDQPGTDTALPHTNRIPQVPQAQVNLMGHRFERIS